MALLSARSLARSLVPSCRVKWPNPAETKLSDYIFLTRRCRFASGK